MTERASADALLRALAEVDLAHVAARCAEGVVVFGTDDGEAWFDRESLLEAIGAMRELRLRARWKGEPVARENWVAGEAEFTLGDGSRMLVRVTMVFAGGLLAHAHYSTAR